MGDIVTIGYVHLEDTGAAFTESLIRMASWDKMHHNRLLHESGSNQAGAVIAIWGKGGDMAHFRNTGAAMFLESASDWLLWVDSDMGFNADALDLLMETADPVTAPIVGGLCFIEASFGHDWKGGLKARLSPTIYDWIFIEGEGYKLLSRHGYERNAVVECAATGTGFLLTHRSVFEKISAWCEANGVPGNIWYQRIPGPRGEPTGEECRSACGRRASGCPIFVDTSVRITHQKTVWLDQSDFDQRPTSIPEGAWPVLPREQWPVLMARPNAEQETLATPRRWANCAGREHRSAPGVCRTRGLMLCVGSYTGCGPDPASMTARVCGDIARAAFELNEEVGLRRLHVLRRGAAVDADLRPAGAVRPEVAGLTAVEAGQRASTSTIPAIATTKAIAATVRISQRCRHVCPPHASSAATWSSYSRGSVTYVSRCAWGRAGRRAGCR